MKTTGNGPENNGASALFWNGLFLVIIGLVTLGKPKFDFRGYYVDFTGYNIQVGLGFLIFGILAMIISKRK